MLLQSNSVKNKQPRMKYDDYISLGSEPKYTSAYEIDQDLEDELLASRFFLKRRVWKNMDKIRQANARLNTPHRAHEKKVFKPRHIHVPA